MRPKVHSGALVQEVRAHCESTGRFPRNHKPGKSNQLAQRICRFRRSGALTEEMLHDLETLERQYTKNGLESLISNYREYYTKNGHYPKRTTHNDGYHLAQKRNYFLKKKNLTPTLRKTLEEMYDNSAIPACEPHHEPLRKRLRSKTAAPLSLPTLNIQWPFSQLILAGVKDTEVRRYALGYRGITLANQEYWIVETPANRLTRSASSVAVIGDAVIGPRPESAQIVGVVSFSHDEEYSSTVTFRGDEARHRIRALSHFDRNDQKKRFAWRVSSRRRLVTPVRKNVKLGCYSRACTHLHELAA